MHATPAQFIFCIFYCLLNVNNGKEIIRISSDYSKIVETPQPGDETMSRIRFKDAQDTILRGLRTVSKGFDSYLSELATADPCSVDVEFIVKVRAYIREFARREKALHRWPRP
jgi:hypothetical protein